MNPAELNARKPHWEKAKFTMVSGERLWHGGLVEEEEVNMQQALNLIGGLVHWQTSAATEKLYSEAIATSKYKAYSRGEVQAFGIRLNYDNGGYSATAPIIARPLLAGEDDIIRAGDKNYDSLIANQSVCTSNERNKKWQIYNTATEFEGTCVNYEDGAIESYEYVQKSCIIPNVNTLTQNTLEINLESEYYDLRGYVEDNPDDPQISIITDALAETNNYPGDCTPIFLGTYVEPIELIYQQNLLGEIVNETAVKEPKIEANYIPSVAPTAYSGTELDVEYTDAYIGCFGRKLIYAAFFKDGDFAKEACVYAEELTEKGNAALPGSLITFNY